MHKGTNLSKTMLCYTIRQNKSPFEVGATKAFARTGDHDGTTAYWKKGFLRLDTTNEIQSQSTLNNCLFDLSHSQLFRTSFKNSIT